MRNNTGPAPVGIQLKVRRRTGWERFAPGSRSTTQEGQTLGPTPIPKSSHMKTLELIEYFYLYPAAF